MSDAVFSFSRRPYVGLRVRTPLRSSSPKAHGLIRSLAAGALLAAVLAPCPVRAQDDGSVSADGDDFFLDSVDVEIVNVDVWVTDKDGKPIDGLKPENFEVFRSGDRVPITAQALGILADG